MPKPVLRPTKPRFDFAESIQKSVARSWCWIPENAAENFYASKLGCEIKTNKITPSQISAAYPSSATGYLKRRGCAQRSIIE
jgi:hypothetical protein